MNLKNDKENKTIGEKKMRKITNLAFALSFLLFLGGCVDSHKERLDQITQGSEESFFDISEIKGMYMVTNNQVGCKTVPLEGKTTTVSEPGKETIVVEESGGNITECLTPAAVALSEDRPVVSFHNGNGPTSSPYTIQTRGVIRSLGLSAAEKPVEVDEGLSIKHTSLVKFRTNSPFLAAGQEKVNLPGDPATSYKVLHKLTPQHLIIMRVSSKEMMAHREYTMADNLGNGEYAYPIAYYNISYFRKENILNADNEKTNLQTFVPVDSVDKATHIKLNLESGLTDMALNRKLKKDFYPAKYFLGSEWYVSESVVDTRPGLEGLIGTSTGSFDLDFRSASKITFFRTDEKLVGYNIGVDERVDIDPSKLSPVVEIPAEGLAFELSADGISEVDVNAIDKTKTPLLAMNFEETSTLKKRISDIVSFTLGATKGELIDLKFAKDSFSYTLQDGATGRQVKYSFLRADNRPEYTERRHYAGDRNTFGFFVQRKAKIITSDENHREEDIEKDFFIQRHNPNETVKFYVSHLTPKYEETRVNGSKDQFGMDIDYREIAKKAIDYWDAAFKRAGAKGVELVGGKENSAPYGDIAYNTINLIESETGSNLLGVGPSLTDPFTGEVINTNSNVYIAPFRSILANDIRNYIKSQTGYLDSVAKNLPPEGKVNSSILGDLVGSGTNVQAFLENILPKRLWNVVAGLYHHSYEGIGFDPELTESPTLNGYEAINLYGLNKFDPKNSQIQRLIKVAQRIPEVAALEASGDVTFDIRNRSDLSYLASQVEFYRPAFYRSYFMTEDRKISQYNSLNRDIENKCEMVSELINRINNKDITELTTEIEASALQSCMSKLIPEKFMATLVHELGHSLGLRHNFKGSSDKKNFFNKEEVKELYGLEMNDLDLPRSSSTMDYVRSEQDRLFFPGHYDIAAIRYGYTNEVELKSNQERPNTLGGKYLDISENMDLKADGGIATIVSNSGETLRDFGFCTDAKASLGIDPMCARHDFGTSPEESVNDIINSYWENFALWSFRYDRRRAGVTGPLRRAGNLDNLKKMYDEWRFHLADYLGSKDSVSSAYLERFSPEEYSELVTELSNDPNFKGAEYLKVRRKIFDFLMEVTFFPNKYCLANGEFGLKALEFEKLRDELKNQVPVGTKVTQCSDDYIQEIIAKKGFAYISEVGLPVNNMWDYVNPADTFDPNFADDTRGLRRPIDTVGTFVDRFLASGTLTSRSSGFGYKHFLEKVFPNILDEPDLFLEYEQKVLERVIQGVDLTSVISRVEGIEFPADQKIQAVNYEAESGFLKALWLSLERGIGNPFVNTTARQERYARFISDDLDQIENAQENGGFVLPIASGGRALIVPGDAEVSQALAQKLIEINQQISAANTVVPSDEEVLGSLPQVLAFMSEGLGDSTEITGEQYLDFARRFIAVLGQVDPFQGAILQDLFLGDLVLYLVHLRSADEAIQQAQAQGVEPPAGAIEFINSTLASWNEKGLSVVAEETQAAVGAQLPPGVVTSVPTTNALSITLVQKGPASAKTALDPIREQVALAKAQFEQNEEDIFAQFDLIRSILIFDTQEAAQQFVAQLSELFSDNGEDSVSHYKRISKSTRADVRFYADKYLKPSVVLNKYLELENKFDAVKPLARKF